MLDISVIMVMRVSLILLFCSGGFLLIRMLQTRLYNLFGLVMFFILYPITILFSVYFDNIFSLMLINTYYPFLALFVKNTFYKEDKKFFLSLLIFIIGLRIYEFCIRLIFHFESLLFPPTDAFSAIFFYSVILITYLQPILAFSWLMIASLTTYKNLKGKNIKPWIKTRYLMITISSFIFLLEVINAIIIRIRQAYMDVFSIYFSVLVISLFSITNLIAWIFPKLFQRSKQIDAEEISEKEILMRIKEELSRKESNGNN